MTTPLTDAAKAQLLRSLLSGSLHGGGVAEFSDHAVGRHFAVGVAGAGNFQLGAQHQRVTELSARSHGLGANGAVVAGDKVHQTKADRLQPGVRGDVKRMVNRPRRLEQDMNR